MVDIETLGTAPGCPVLAIGAVMFDPLVGRIGFPFYINLETYSQAEAGLIADPKTLAWWGEQSPAAQARLQNPKPESAHKGFDLFRRYLIQQGAQHLWGHGAGFDQPILRRAMAAFGLELPCAFFDDRDTRTLYALAGVSPDRTKGVHHDALVDARNQTLAVFESYASLGLTSHGFIERIRMVLRYNRTGKFYDHTEAYK
jgi:hypothetical protein